jgi:type IV pilus assembly protein PilM
LLGLTLLFSLGDYRVLAKVNTAQFKSAVDQAKSVSKRGADLKSAFDKAKGEFDGKLEEGKALIVDDADRALWPKFLKTLSAFFPDPVADRKIENPDDPSVQDELDKLRVHIDAIKPVWRTDLKTEWFDLLDPKLKMLMHPYDSANPPSDAGWVIQLVCHHYNPYPSRKQMDYKLTDPRRVEFGPYQYITERILSKLNDPVLRLFGVHHVALAWMSPDKEWTSEKGASYNNLASNTVPLLGRATPPEAAAGAGGAAGGASGPGAMGAMGAGAMMSNMASMKGMRGAGMAMGDRSGMAMAGAMSGMMGNMMGSAGRMSAEDTKKQLKTLTRTDFLLQFVWQPLKREEQAQTDEQRLEKYKEFKTKMEEAEKNHPAVVMPKSEEIESASLKQSEAINSAINKALGPGSGGATGAGPAGTPGAGTPPGTTPGFGPPPGAANAPGVNKGATGPQSK